MQYSNAFNSLSILSGGPDIQTGLYTMSFPFGELMSLDGFGPSFNLSMSYFPLATGNNANKAFGNGWSLTLPEVNRATNKVTFIDGQTFTIDTSPPDKEWSLKNHKVKDIKIIHDSKKDQVLIQNKDRSQIFIDDNNQSDSYGKIVRYEQADGRYLTFNGRKYSDGLWRLDSIEDAHENLLCTIEYGDLGGFPSRETIVTLYPQKRQKRVFTLSLSSGTFFLEKITGSEADIVYTIKPTTQGNYFYIQSVEHPSGITELMDYTKEIDIPGSSETIAVLSKYTKSYGKNLKIIQTFEYDGSGNNFFGNNLINSPIEDEDLMEEELGTYYYTNTLTQGNQTTESTWNKFHQLIKERISYDGGKHVLEKINTYCSHDKLRLSRQHRKYELPKRQTIQFIEYEDTTQEVVANNSDYLTQTYEYDVYGNIISRTDFAGVTEKSTYYKNDDDDSLPTGAVVPTHPFKLVDSLKQKEIIAPDGITKKGEYYYKEFDKVAGNSDKQYLLFQHTFSDTTITYDYYNDLSAAYHGALWTKEVEKSRTKTLETTTYSFLNHSIITQKTFKSHDGIEISQSSEKDLYYGLILSETDVDQITTTYSYDNAGRPKQITEALGSPYEKKVSIDYLVKASFKGWCIEKTDLSSLLKTRLYIDDEQEVHMQKEQKENGIFVKTKDLSYDGLHRVIEECELDYFNGEVISKNTTSSEYNHWGLPYKKTNEQGVIKEITFDPFERTSVEKVYTSTESIIDAQVKKEYNLFGAPIKEEIILDDVPYSTQTTVYNGLGIVQKHTNKAGYEKTFSYDDYHRIKKIEDNIDAILNIGYQRFTSYNIVHSSRLSSASSTYNERLINITCDGLNRATNIVVNNTSTSYSYPTTPDAKKMLFKPSSKTNGRNQTLLFDYVPELGLEQQMSCLDDNSADYSSTFAQQGDTSPLGSLKQTTTNTGQTDISYDSHGLLQTLNHSYYEGQLESKIEVLEKTFLGKPIKVKITYPDATSKEICYQYDESGNLIHQQDDALEIDMSYDLLNRPIKQTIKERPKGTILQKKEYTYETDFARLKDVVIQQGDDQFVQEYTYYPYDKLKTKTTTITLAGTGEQSLVESYSYDTKARLASYQADSFSSTNLLPQDEQGNSIKSQSFSYEINDAIKESTTTLEDGTTVGKIYYYQNNLLDYIQTTTSHPNYPAYMGFEYDGDGNVISIKEGDDAGSASTKVAMDYNCLSKLIKSEAAGVYSKDYNYDGLGNLIGRGDEKVVYGLENKPMMVLNATNSTTFTLFNGETVVEKSSTGQAILGTNYASSPVFINDLNQSNYTNYSPFGMGNSNSKIGYNNELLDKEMTSYHLGNGERSFSPQYGLFLSKDRLSPLGEGGLNGYMFCAGDPINFSDPSGNLVMALIKKTGEFIYNTISNYAQGDTIGMALLGAGVETAVPGKRRSDHKAAKSLNQVPTQKATINYLYKRLDNGTNWHKEKIGKGTYMYGSDSFIQGVDVKSPIERIRKHKSINDVYIYTGAHGRRHGNNWGTTRRKAKAEFDFLESDIMDYRNAFSAQKNLHIIDIANISRKEFIDLHKRKGCHIEAYCYGRNDEALREAFNLPAVPSWVYN